MLLSLLHFNSKLISETVRIVTEDATTEAIIAKYILSLILVQQF